MVREGQGRKAEDLNWAKGLGQEEMGKHTSLAHGREVKNVSLMTGPGLVGLSDR